ncbi:MAG: MaoC/PaaZ C-terminal domain-containing protein [Caldilineaceae bacterium]
MTERKMSRPRGLTFEEFQIGDQVESVGRTVTETDVVNFAAISGDWNLIHTDAEYSKEQMYGQRMAHGLLVLSIASGQAVRLGFMEDTVIAFRSIDWSSSSLSSSATPSTCASPWRRRRPCAVWAAVWSTSKSKSSTRPAT